MPKISWGAVVGVAVIFIPLAALASSEGGQRDDFVSHWVGITCLLIFTIAYAFVIGEEATKLRKSKPVMVAAGLIWILVALAYERHGDSEFAATAFNTDFLEFAELFLFLLAAMTFLNTMEERGVFDALRSWLVSQRFSLRKIFWITGLIAFSMSPIADNMTTALLLATVVVAVGRGQSQFIVVGCVNVVVAANAGGAFSPFGDITTLMVWQKGLVGFHEFHRLFVPALVQWIVPAFIMAHWIPDAIPRRIRARAQIHQGAGLVVALFLVTITCTVLIHVYLHLPPVMGMMTGLGCLAIYGYVIDRRQQQSQLAGEAPAVARGRSMTVERKSPIHLSNPGKKFDIFKRLAEAEWDTLMFFYGVILCVGGLGALGYLALLSETVYGQLGPTAANILVGAASSIVDNIPLMFAILTMRPEMEHGQWLLVTLTAGVGGSLLSIGSAAGVAAMGVARGVYTFASHLRWSWAVGLGYVASIAVHFFVNAHHF